MAREQLTASLGVSVASGYGRPDYDLNKPAEYFLIVWSNKKIINMPSEFKGFKVVRRDIPVASAD